MTREQARENLEQAVEVALESGLDRVEIENSVEYVLDMSKTVEPY